jgi:hypothetical protein
MPYIGKTPTVGNFQVCDAISVVNGQAAYTLQVGGANVAPESANHMLVSLNGILQKPGSSFTISGSTMTFASNLATGDVIDFVQILGNVLDIGQPSDDTVKTASIQANAVTGAKLNTDVISAQTALTSSPDSTDELLISDAGTLKRIDVSLVGGANTPMWFANKTDTTSVANTTNTKCTFNVEIIDTDSAFASSTFTVPSGAAGKYFVFGSTQFDSNITNEDFNVAFIYINGAIQAKGVFTHAVSSVAITSQVQGIFDLSASDTVELYVRHNEGGSLNLRGESGEKTTFFGGYKLIT